MASAPEVDLPIGLWSFQYITLVPGPQDLPYLCHQPPRSQGIMAERKLKIEGGQRGGEATQLGLYGDPEKPFCGEVVVGPGGQLLTCQNGLDLLSFNISPSCEDPAN